MDKVWFFAYALAGYVVSILILGIVAYYIEKLRADKPIHNVQKPVKKLPLRRVGKDKLVPQGKTAFCTFCQVYLIDDEYLKNHELGKKHKKTAGDTKNWYDLRDSVEATKSPISPQEVKKAAEQAAKVEDISGEWKK